MSNPRRSAPSVMQQVLGARLRTMREHSGFTAKDAAVAVCRESAASITKMERGEARLDPGKVRDLLPLYGVTGPAAKDFMDLVAEANRPGWWTPYDDVLPPGVARHVSLEAGASMIRGVETSVVPGLLQTEEYCTALLRLGFPHDQPATLARRVELRMKRQELLTQSNPPLLWLALDQAALARPVGNKQVMQDQIEHLRIMARRPKVSLQLIPFRAGQYHGALGPFTIFRFPVADFNDVVAEERVTGTEIIEERAAVEEYRLTFERLFSVAEPISHTDSELARISKEHYA